MVCAPPPPQPRAVTRTRSAPSKRKTSARKATAAKPSRGAKGVAVAPPPSVELAKAATAPREPAAKPSTRQSVGGTAFYGGHIATRETNPKLVGARKWRTYENVLHNCRIVAAGVRYFLALVVKAGWKFEPRDDSPEAAKIAEQVDAIVTDLGTPFRRIVRRLAMYRFHGFAAAEWVTKRREDGAVGFADLYPIDPHTVDRWIPDAHNSVVGLVQRNPQTHADTPIARSKLVYVVDDALGSSPEGVGLLRHIVDAFEKLQRYEQLEGWGYETDLRGVPLIHAPLTAWEEWAGNDEGRKAQVAKWQALFQRIIDGHVKGPDTGFLIDSQPYSDSNGNPSSVPQQRLELLKGDAGPHEEIANAIKRLTYEIARILGVQALLAGSDGAGSLALSREAFAALRELIDSTLEDLAEAIQKDFVERLGQLNGWPDDKLPWVKTDKVQLRDVADIAAALRDLAAAGVTVTRADELVAEFFDLLGLTAPSGEDDELDAMLGGEPVDPDDLPADPEDIDEPEDDEPPPEPEPAPVRKRRTRRKR